MRTKYYKSMAELKTIRKGLLTTKERILHQDFIDKNGNTTNGSNGRLSIIDEIHTPYIEKQMTQADFIKMLAKNNRIKLT